MNPDPPTVGLPFSDVVKAVLQAVFTSINGIPESGAWPATTWTFLGIAVTFLATRGITRFIRARGASGGPSTGPVRDIIIGGVHIHHQVFGIVFMLVAGLSLVAMQPAGWALGVLATLLGVGIGLAFDEFALWLHLDDVYWSAQGRKSIDAVAVVLVLTGEITVIAGTVRDLGDTAGLADVLGSLTVWLAVIAIGLTFVPAVICLAKGKAITAGAGVVYIPIGLIGAFRLAKPGSWWARHVYRPNSRRRRRSEHRFGVAYTARWNRVRDLVGGTPSKP